MSYTANEAMAREMQLPGYDGGKFRKTFDFSTYTFTPADGVVPEQYIKTFLRLLLMKGNKAVPQAVVEEALDIFTEYPGISGTVHALNMPKTYRGMLSALQKCGVIISPEVVYDICDECMHVYRLKTRHCTQCPHCNANRYSDAACKKAKRTFIYRPVRHWQVDLNSKPALAKGARYHSEQGGFSYINFITVLPALALLPALSLLGWAALSLLCWAALSLLCWLPCHCCAGCPVPALLATLLLLCWLPCHCCAITVVLPAMSLLCKLPCHNCHAVFIIIIMMCLCLKVYVAMLCLCHCLTNYLCLQVQTSPSLTSWTAPLTRRTTLKIPL
jgi:hypothetical protein